MHILTIGGSAIGEKSMSKTVFDKVISYTQKKSEVEFTHTGVLYNKVKPKELVNEVEKADLIVFTTSPFHCAIQSGLAQFIIDNFSNGGIQGKKVAGFISSSGLFEKNCEAQLSSLLTNCGAYYIGGYSSVEYELLGNHEKPADINIRTGNNIEDMSQWLIGIIKAIGNNNNNEIVDKPTVVITSLTKEDNYFTKCSEIISKRYRNVEYIFLGDYKIADCTGCKYCYTDKVCCIKDDYKKLEEKIKGYDNIIHIVDMVSGILNPLYLRYVQRDVHNGLYPYPENARKKVVRLIKAEGTDVSLIREYLTSLSSFGRMFSFTLVDNEVEHFIEHDIILENQQNTGTFPNMDGYCKNYTRHFDSLSIKLQNLLQKEYEFFKNHSYEKTPTANPNIREIHSIEDARMAQMGRIMPIMEFLKEEEKKKGIFPWKR